jgi:glycosyltransferase involved in cell wall biosynthesis
LSPERRPRWGAPQSEVPLGLLIASPGTGPFVRATVEALDACGQLDRFLTTLVALDRRGPGRWLEPLGRLRWTGLGEFRGRRPAPAVAAEKVETHAIGEVLRVVGSRLDPSGVVTDAIWDWMSRDFDRWAAGRIGPGTTGVYGYEYNARALFQEAARLGLKRILEAPCAEHEYVSRLLEAELTRLPELDSSYHRRVRKQRAARTARRREEFELATLVIANSRHTRDSYAASGLRTEHFRVIPLGAPPVAMTPRPDPGSETLRLIWAGAFSVGKGAHVLLESLARIATLTPLELLVYGRLELPARVVSASPSGVSFAGPVPQAELFRQFSRADALVLPSLSDGFGMVVTEALAHGLPVITTPMVGAAGFVEDGVNGLIVPAGDRDALGAALVWCAANRSRLAAMAAPARAAAAAWQWSDYRREVGRVVCEHLQHA